MPDIYDIQKERIAKKCFQAIINDDLSLLPDNVVKDSYYKNLIEVAKKININFLQLSKKVFYFNNIDEMKSSDKLKVGDMVTTKGYYIANDGGNAEYEIVEDNNLTDDGGSIHDLNNSLKAKLIIKNNTVNTKQFGTYNIESNDDSLSIIKAINYAIDNNIGKVLILGNIYIKTLIDIDFKKISVDITNDTFIKSTVSGISLYFHNMYGSKLKLLFKDGGNNTANDFALKIDQSSYCNIDIKSKNYKGTTLWMAGNKKENKGVTSMNCDVSSSQGFRSLLHGVEGGYQEAFGQYNQIIDMDSQEPIRFINSADVTVNHIENHYTDSTFTKNSVEIVESVMHMGTIAIGGTCKNLLYIDSTGSVSINKLYVCSEDERVLGKGNIKTNGLTLADKWSHNVHVNFLFNNSCHCGLNVPEIGYLKNIGKLQINNLYSENVAGSNVIGVNDIPLEGYILGNTYKIECPQVSSNSWLNYILETPSFFTFKDKYIKVMSINIKKQYDDIRLVLKIAEESNNASGKYATIIIGCKQELDFTNIPNVSIQFIDNLNYSKDFISANIVKKDESYNIDLYYKIPENYSSAIFKIDLINKQSKLDNYLVIYDTFDEKLDSLPANGTIVNIT